MQPDNLSCAEQEKTVCICEPFSFLLNRTIGPVISLCDHM